MRGGSYEDFEMVGLLDFFEFLAKGGYGGWEVHNLLLKMMGVKQPEKQQMVKDIADVPAPVEEEPEKALRKHVVHNILLQRH